MTTRQALALATPCMSRLDIESVDPVAWKLRPDGFGVCTWMSVIVTGPFSRHLPMSVRPAAWHVMAAAFREYPIRTMASWVPVDQLGAVGSAAMTSLVLHLLADVGGTFDEWLLEEYRMRYWRRCVDEDMPHRPSKAARLALCYQEGFKDIRSFWQ